MAKSLEKLHRKVDVVIISGNGNLNHVGNMRENLRGPIGKGMRGIAML